MSVDAPCAGLELSEEGIASSEIGIMDGCDPLRGWDRNLDPLRSTKCSLPLTHLPSPMMLVFKEEILN